MNVPGENDPRPKIVVIHQNLAFSPSTVSLTWRALHERRCAHYQLVARRSCDLNSNTMVLINWTKEETIILEAEIFSNFTYFSLTVYDEQGNEREEFFLESFQFVPGSKCSWP